MATITGTSGNDTLTPTATDDIIDALAGDDLINVGNFDYVIIQPSVGNDTITYSAAASATIRYEDLSSDITVTVTDAGATINKGSDGTDTVNGFSSDYAVGFDVQLGSGTNTVTIDNSNLDFLSFSSGSGNDTFTVTNGGLQVNYFNVSSGITYTSNNGSRVSGTVTGEGVGTDTLTNVRVIQGTTSFADTFNGGDGDEYFRMRGGDDTINGGGGTDTIRFDRSDMSAVTIDVEAGTATGAFRDVAFTKTFSGLEHYRSSDEADSVTGSSSGESFDGQDGNDTINAGNGDDTISGGNDDDFLVGAAGNDTTDGGNGDDEIWAGAGDAGNDSVWGGDGNDQIGGGAGNDDLNGGGDNDSIYGGSGADTVFGDDGSDFVWGGAGADDVLGRAGADTIGGGAGSDTVLGGSEADVAYGGADNDQVFGEEGNDELYGGAGNDFMRGDAGDDTMYGGDGNDTFDMNAGHGDDFIGGFETKGDNTIDLFDLGLSGFDALSITQVGNDVQIGTGEGTITLWNTNSSDITADDFIF